MDAEELGQALRLALATGRQQRTARTASYLGQACAALASLDPGLLARTQQWLKQPNTRVIHWFQAEYPESLRQIDRPPLVLFCQGQTNLLNAFQIAVVGSRKATPGGIATASHLAEQLARRGAVVTSGLAMGIDAAAHRAALSWGRSVAVIASGPDIFYPPRNRSLQRELAGLGLVVSEFPPGWPAKQDHFPRRNRIIAGLSAGVLVVEAVAKSGSLITARLALEQNREVFAVPNSIWEAAAEGGNRLIQRGAKLVITVDDILSEFTEFEAAAAAVPAAPENKSQQGLANSPLLANVGYEATTIDTLVARSGLSVAAVNEQLVLLELEGFVASIPGGFIRMRRR